MSKILKVGLVQQSCGPDREANLRASEAGVREAARRGARLVLLQELHASVYFCQHENTELFELAEPIRTLGEYKVPYRISRGVTATLTVRVERQ